MHKLSFFKMSTSLYFITVLSVLFFYSVLLIHRLLFVVPLIWETLLLCKPFLGHCNGKLPIEIVRKQMLSSFFSFLPSFFDFFYCLVYFFNSSSEGFSIGALLLLELFIPESNHATAAFSVFDSLLLDWEFEKEIFSTFYNWVTEILWELVTINVNVSELWFQ